MRRGYGEPLDPVETFSGLEFGDTLMFNIEMARALRCRARVLRALGEAEEANALTVDFARMLAGLPPCRSY